MAERPHRYSCFLHILQSAVLVDHMKRLYIEDLNITGYVLKKFTEVVRTLRSVEVTVMECLT